MAQKNGGKLVATTKRAGACKPKKKHPSSYQVGRPSLQAALLVLCCCWLLFARLPLQHPLAAYANSHMLPPPPPFPPKLNNTGAETSTKPRHHGALLRCIVRLVKGLGGCPRHLPCWARSPINEHYHQAPRATILLWLYN